MKQHETSAAELLSEEFEDDGRYNKTPNRVLTTWLVSFQQIHQLDELSVDCLSFMACINPRDIPQSILLPISSAKKRVDILGLLSAYSFISEHVSKGSFSLHRLVHLATRNWIRKNQVFDRWVRRVTQRLDDIFPDDDYKNQGLWRIYLPHALYLTNSPEFRHIYSEYIDFPLRVGRSLQIVGKYDEAKTLFVENLSIREKALGAEHIDTLASVSYLGSVLEDQGKYKEAEAMYRRVLDGREKGLGPEHPDTLTSISHLGWALKEQGKYEEAEAMHRRALKGREKALGSEHPDTLDSVTYLSSVLHLQGKDEGAEAMHRRALQGFEKVLGPEHPETLGSVRYLAFPLEDQGKYEEAEAMYQRVLEGREKVFGPEHPNTLNVVSDLGVLLQQKGKYEEAEAMNRRDLEGARKL